MEIDLTKPTKTILKEWASHILKQNSELTGEEALELAQKTLPFLKCPLNNNERVLPTTCMFCPYGHMTECHHPFTCKEAQCSHYYQDNENCYGDEGID